MKLLCKLTDSDFGFNVMPCSFRSRRATRAVVFNESKIALMYMGDMDCLSLPGGGIKKSESIKSALLREIKEETGCDVKIDRELGKINEIRTHRKLRQVSYCYLVKVIKKGKPSFTDYEIKRGFKLKWVPVKGIISRLSKNVSDKYEGAFITKRTQVAIKEALKYINTKFETL